MKRIWVTYYLFTDHSKPSDDLPHEIETAENCIMICLPETVADDILKEQEKSKYIHCFGREDIAGWIEMLAHLQGYQEGRFVSAEAAE